MTEGVTYEWRINEGAGTIEGDASEYATFVAPPEPCLVRISVTAMQAEVRVDAEGFVTVTDSILPAPKDRSVAGHGLPGYTLEHAPGKLWRSRLDAERNLIVVNSGHRDYAFATRSKALKLRYLIRLYSKEMVLRSFPGLRGENCSTGSSSSRSIPRSTCAREVRMLLARGLPERFGRPFVQCVSDLGWSGHGRGSAQSDGNRWLRVHRIHGA